jgi:hypothetical protein
MHKRNMEALTIASYYTEPSKVLTSNIGSAFDCIFASLNFWKIHRF